MKRDERGEACVRVCVCVGRGGGVCPPFTPLAGAPRRYVTLQTQIKRGGHCGPVRSWSGAEAWPGAGEGRGAEGLVCVGGWPRRVNCAHVVAWLCLDRLVKVRLAAGTEGLFITAPLIKIIWQA